MINEKLLLDLFRVPTTSCQEQTMSFFIRNYLAKNKIPYTIDNCGNIFNINNKTPILSAHMDSVQDSVDMKLSNFINIHNNYISGYGVIGADDKCGIYIILELLKAKNDLNFVFSVEEEIGGRGIIEFVATNDLRHIPYGIVLDRRGASDIICTHNDYGTEEFENIIAEIGKVFGYKPAMGLFSDGDYLNEQMSLANLSVGYYNPHEKTEFAKINEISHAMSFTWNIIKNVKKRFNSPTRIKTRYNGWGDYGYGYGYGEDDYYDAEFACFNCYKHSWNNIYLASLNKHICKSCFASLYEEIVMENIKFLEDEDEVKEVVEVEANIVEPTEEEKIEEVARAIKAEVPGITEEELNYVIEEI